MSPGRGFVAYYSAGVKIIRHPIAFFLDKEGRLFLISPPKITGKSLFQVRIDLTVRNSSQFLSGFDCGTETRVPGVSDCGASTKEWHTSLERMPKGGSGNGKR